MRILVTGATGLVGKKLLERLFDRGHEIAVTSRKADSGVARRLGVPCAVHSWDGKEPFPDAALDGIDAVVHLAGENVAGGRWTADRKKRISQSRTEGTRAVVEAMHRQKVHPSALLCASAIGFYGDRGDETVDECSPRGAGFLADVCVAWEAEANRAKAFGIRVVCFRIGVVLAPEGGVYGKLRPIFRLGLGGKVGSGRQWMSWIHREDLVGMMLRALDDAQWEGPVNATAPNPVPNAEFSLALAKELHRPAALPAPAFAVRAALGEMSAVLLAGQRVLPTRATQLGFPFQFPELAAALADVEKNAKGELLVQGQFVSRSVEDTFPFFSDEKNLEAITPKFLHFRVVGKSTERIETGTLIDYRMSLHGLPMKWRTRIEDWQPGIRFIDTQLRGPYRVWHHTHEFRPWKGGTWMIDRVRYELPLGWLGRWLAGWKVRRDVRSIFQYRAKVIGEKFPPPEGTR